MYSDILHDTPTLLNVMVSHSKMGMFTMRPNLHTPQHALNKAFRKVKPNRADFETFKAQLHALLAGVKAGESEEFHKNLIRDFLQTSYYGADHFINTKGRNDLVIHEGKTDTSPVGVILETKKPDNKSEMLTPNDLNRKALHELILYYLRGRVANQNLSVKHLIATNTFEWFIFDSSDFEKRFVENKAFVKRYEDFAAGRLSSSKTEFFYSDIAEPFIKGLSDPLPFTHVDLRDYQPGETSEKKLITLYKLFSPEHLLKLPFANDSNTLDRRFYAELLHIIGLSEVKEGGKKLIVRQAESERGEASLIENAMIQLDDKGKLSRLAHPAHYGNTREERLFNVALELAITWINRILFLKLLESQLKSHHQGSEDYAFLNSQRLHNYDDLNTLFFHVLAKPVNERRASVSEFAHVPYLNSSLFELSELEHRTLDMSALRDERELGLYSSTVLKDAQGKKRTGKLNTLDYLFAFLDAYDFSSEGSEAVQEERKTLINASVLGLIFEKINGYKDGSFFTPGFITMYMCRESIRRAVLQKFNAVKGWRCETVDDLYNKIDDKREANAIINSLKLCDPAVGSGHFLVSALNELLTLKSDLKILLDEHGKTLRDYTLEVSNDELVLTDDDGELFAYNPKNPESQRVQKTLFSEKQTLIENCLFGVDINPNSVKICRLRLWIELLKHAYYKEVDKGERQLETLPNIDINIKVGNSLISRFPLDADLKKALKKSKLSVADYRRAVNTYRNATDKEEKREMESLIGRIKRDFRTEIAANDPKVIRLENLKVKLATLEQAQLFEESAAQKKEREKLAKDIAKLAADIEEIRSNQIFENAFEWRFEFPEVLNDDGAFVGFNVILGNPPYIRQESIGSAVKEQLGRTYGAYHGSADLLVYFVELGVNLLSTQGTFSYITANKWIRANYGKALRRWLKEKHLLQIIDYGDLPVFEEATPYPCILSVANEPEEESAKPSSKAVQIVKMENLEDDLHDYVATHAYAQPVAELDDSGWSLASKDAQKVLDKISKAGVPLEQYVDGQIFIGVKTGYNRAFIIDEETREKLIEEDPKSEELIKPYLVGREIKRYRLLSVERYLIFTRRGTDIDQYPAIKRHLTKFREDLEPKPKNWQGREWKGRKSGTYNWWEIQDNVAYFQEFEKPKIAYSEIASRGQFTIDEGQTYFDMTAFILGSDSKYLLGILNSTLWTYIFSSVSSQIRGGFLRWKRQYIAPLPIRTLNLSNPTEQEQRERMTRLVDEMLGLHEQKAGAAGAELERVTGEIAALDAQIDALVYELYGLTEEEVEVVEAAVAG